MPSEQQGTYITGLAAASGIFTGVYTIVKNKPNPGVLTFSAVLNSGVTASVFFGMLIPLCSDEIFFDC